jgi:hypothetical protein
MKNKKFVVFGTDYRGVANSVMTTCTSRSAAKRWMKRNKGIQEGPFFFLHCDQTTAADKSWDIWGAQYAFHARHPGNKFWRYLKESINFKGNTL